MLRRRMMDDLERMRIKMYLAFGGFHYRTIAARVYGMGRPRYVPSDSEVSRIGKVAREENLSPLDWRRGKSSEAKKVLSKVERTRPKTHLKVAV